MPNQPDLDHELDDELMAAFAGGDARAFEQLYRRHAPALYRFVRRLLGPSLANHTDDVFQDVWQRVVRTRSAYRPGPARFRTWLFAIAHHRTVDCLRTKGRELPLDDIERDGDGAPYTPDAVSWVAWPEGDAASHDERVFWRRAGARLLDCLEQLPAAQKTAFLLHHEDGVPVAELARALDLGFETAKSRLRYAMARLRTCMGAYLPAGQA